MSPSYKVVPSETTSGKFHILEPKGAMLFPKGQDQKTCEHFCAHLNRAVLIGAREAKPVKQTLERNALARDVLLAGLHGNSIGDYGSYAALAEAAFHLADAMIAASEKATAEPDGPTSS